MNNDTIVAISTPRGVGGIAVIRLSGAEALAIADSAWKGKCLASSASHTAHLGSIVDIGGNTIDRVVATVFKGPNSFTGEDVVEISCHGSLWIQRGIVNEMVRRGARPADPGEFTQRAYLNGRLDLAQAEGVADLIAASSRASHRLALQQASGQFSAHLNNLRDQLVEYASLLELELDFSEEEVEFADREKLRQLADRIIEVLRRLADSFAAGKAFKEGIPVVIAGIPNAGKSSLLNLLLEDDKAIVSNIPGTTRDIIEDTHEIDGILFRFIDTAGLRETDDEVERIGIERAEQRLKKASIILWLIDSTADIRLQLDDIAAKAAALPHSRHILLYNKSDLSECSEFSESSESSDSSDNPESSDNPDNPESSDNSDSSDSPDNPESSYNPEFSKISKSSDPAAFTALSISAKTGSGIEELKRLMAEDARKTTNPDSDIIVTNARHYALLVKGLEAIERSRVALEKNLSADFIAQDVREALHHLGALTGSITTPDLLASIFTRFCIGK